MYSCSYSTLCLCTPEDSDSLICLANNFVVDLTQDLNLQYSLI